MKYQNDPTNPDYTPSPQERFKAGYIRRAGSAVIISIFFSRGVGTLLKSSTGKFGAVFNICLAVVLMTYAIVNLVQYILLAKNPEKLEELYRQHTDERNALIREKTAGGSFTATVYVICTMIIVFSYISVMVTLALAGLLLAMLIIRVLLKIYYEKKY